jgi:hypothetical protein
MTAPRKKTMLGGSITGVGLAFLFLAFHETLIALRDIREFGFCVTGYLRLVCVAAFALTTLCGMVVLGFARRQEGG